MYVKIKNENEKQFLLTVIKEELRIRNRKFSKKIQKQRETAIEYSALAILLYESELAEELIKSYKTRRKLEQF